MFIKNKYYRWYYQIINKARKRGKPDGYYEKHHIIPKCLGGRNNIWNTINLTYREHYIVHWLLIKFTEGEFLRKMNLALYLMMKGSHRVGKVPSRWFVRSRQAARDTPRTEEFKRKMSIFMKGRKHGIGNKSKTGKTNSEQHRQRIREANIGNKHTLGFKHSDESKKMIGAASKDNKYAFGFKHTEETKQKFKNRKITEETRLKMSASQQGRKHSEETKQRMSIVAKERTKDQAIRKEFSVRMLGNKHGFGNKGRSGRAHLDETRIKMSLSQKNRILNKKLNLPIGGLRNV